MSSCAWRWEKRTVCGVSWRFGHPSVHTSGPVEDFTSRRPPRRERPKRRPERQQIMLRRGLALGGGLLLLILIVLGVKGCLDARANRELSDYARNVTAIVEETQQTSKTFFERLEDPGSASVTDFVDQVNADRSAMDGYQARIDDLSTPGDMSRAQGNLELTYQLRANAMDEIADKMSTALGDAGAEKAMAGIAKQMQKLLASDVVYEQVVRPEVDDVLASNGISDSDLPKSTFLADEQWLDETTVSDALAAVSGGSTSTASGLHGTGLSSVTVNGTELIEGAPTTIAAEEAVEVEVNVQNQGESTENGVNVAVTYEGNTVKGEINELPAGEIGTAVIPLTPTPSGEVTLEIEVEAVDGEQVTENNEASYTLLIE
ncbi:MAG TPA: CARDB domain-containing protein [Solirubrobacterales bacterium]|nr:CARDB domain-containing protein [Solirubrobacterales bacterium]